MFEDEYRMNTMNIECTNAEMDILTYLPSADIKQVKKRDGRLRRLQFTVDNNANGLQPIHIIMGAGDFQRIKTTEPPILGKNPDKDPGGELTMLGWTLTGRMVTSHTETEKEFFVNSGPEDFKRMCSLDVLGITCRQVKIVPWRIQRETTENQKCILYNSTPLEKWYERITIE